MPALNALPPLPELLAFGFPALPELLVLGMVFILVILPVWKICEKAGFPGWYSLAVYIPLLNILLLYYLAFAPWPALLDAELLRARKSD